MISIQIALELSCTDTSVSKDNSSLFLSLNTDLDEYSDYSDEDSYTDNITDISDDEDFSADRSSEDSAEGSALGE